MWSPLLGHNIVSCFEYFPEDEKLNSTVVNYYLEMHYSAKRGLAIACRMSVCL